MGSVWAMHRILTPEVMSQLNAAVLEAERQTGEGGVYRQRVEIVRYSLNFAKIWFAARDALNRFDLLEAEKQGAAFKANYAAGFAKYPLFFGPNREWSPNIERYFDLFHGPALKDAGRIVREATVVYRLPDALQAHLETVEGGAKPSGRVPDTVKDEWRELKTFSASLDEQGLPLFRGVIWYRHQFTLPAQFAGAQNLTLWCGGIDSKLQVWLNGQSMGEKRAANFGTCEVDLTKAIKRGEPNDLLLAVDNTFPNEIGIGGILRPVLIYTKDKMKAPLRSLRPVFGFQQREQDHFAD